MNRLRFDPTRFPVAATGPTPGGYAEPGGRVKRTLRTLGPAVRGIVLADRLGPARNGPPDAARGSRTAERLAGRVTVKAS